MNCGIAIMTLSSTEVEAWPQSLSFTEVKQQWATLVLRWVTACFSTLLVRAERDIRIIRSPVCIFRIRL